MYLRKTLLTVVAAGVLVSGCATAARPVAQGLPEASRTMIASTDIVVSSQQKEIFFFEPAAAASGGGVSYVPVYSPASGAGMSAGTAAAVGVIGLLVVAGMAAAQAADEASDLKPLRATLEQFDVEEAIRTEIKTAAAGAEWLHASEPRVLKQPKQADLEGALASSKSSGVLMINASYSINTNADELTIAITPAFYPSTPQLKALLTEKPSASAAKTHESNALYRNAMSYRAQVPNAVTGRREANIAAWTVDNGAAIRAAMTAGSAKLAQMLVTDLQTPAAPVNPKTTTLRPINAELVTGHVLRNDADGQVVLLGSGAQVYLANSTLEPLTKAGPAEPGAGGKKMSARERAKLQKEEEKARKAKAKADKQKAS